MQDHELNARLQRVVEEVFTGGTLRSQRKLVGGVSAKVHELEIALPGGEILRVVLRVRGGPGWTGQSAISLEMEFMLQEALHRAGFPVPAPHHVDSSCLLLPEHFMLMERLEGSVHVATGREDAATRMADALLRLHELNRDSPGLPQLPNRVDPIAGACKYLTKERAAVLETALPGRGDSASAAAEVLLHGDFWPGNMLWRSQVLVGMLDWEDAAFGDPMSDVACARLEILCSWGSEAARAFTDRYRSHRGLDDLSLRTWEIYVSAAALNAMESWGLAPEEDAMRRATTNRFLERALATLSEDCRSAGLQMNSPVEHNL